MNRKADFVNTYFGSIYLTIIALLQGIALFQLVPYLIDYFTSQQIRIANLYTVQLFLMLLIIFVVWHHYVNGILYLRWFPNIIDALIPFAISISEFFMMSFLKYDYKTSNINLHMWLQTFACFLIFGSIAYFAAAIRHQADLFTNMMDKKAAMIHGRNIRRFYKRAGVAMTLQALFSILILITHRDWLLWLSLLFFVLHIIISEYFHIRHIHPAFDKGISEFGTKES